MRGLSNFCDFFVILTASSGRRAEAVAESIQDGFREKGLAVRAKEGSEDTKWILIDLFDVVAHIFEADTRQFYNLDRLWADAPEIKLPARKSPSTITFRRFSARPILPLALKKKNVSRKTRKPAG